MSVDPASAAAGPSDLPALIASELTALAADAQTLRGMLVENAVISARVLPSNGLTDLIEIAGLRVAASLPPTVRPGDVITVQVTGFDADRILLQILGTGAQAAVESPTPGYTAGESPPAAAPAAPATASAAPAATSAPPVGSTAGAPAAPSGRAVGVPLSTIAPATSPGAVRPSAGTIASAASRAVVAEGVVGDAGAAGSPVRAPIAPPPQPTTIEARLAAARAASLERALDVAGDDTNAAARPPSSSLPPASRFVAPPPIAPRSPVASAASATAVSGTNAAGASESAAPPRASGLNAYAEPVALLRALRLAVTPTTVAAAQLALDHPERLPAALAALERALPQLSDDASIATLRTLLAFVGRISPDSPALASQLAAYVEHVVAGPEPKLATLLAALRTGAADVPDGSAESSPGLAGAGVAEASGNGAAPLPAAVAAERSAALDANLKQTILALAADGSLPEAVSPAIAGALTALTSVQLTAAQLLASRPDGLAFTVPLATANGPATAQIRVQRDPRDGASGGVAPANFRIAFVLETAHYGTVAIDLVTVGREVTVDVRTEGAPAMRAFRDALGRLTERLETLRYHVASAGASVGTTTTVAVDAPGAVSPIDPDAVVDRSV